jgi:hypothetical protein
MRRAFFGVESRQHEIRGRVGKGWLGEQNRKRRIADGNWPLRALQLRQL